MNNNREKEQQLFLSNEQQSREGTTVVPFQMNNNRAKEQQLFLSNEQHLLIFNHLNG
jgi:hypothetical protein